MKYIKSFNTEADFSAGKSSLTKPYVVYVKESDKVYYMGDNIIEIDDPVAKEVVLANFDLDGDGELSKQEALQVTDGSSIKSLFGYTSEIKTTVTDLTFLKYFNNLVFPASMIDFFNGLTSLESIDLSGCDFSKVTALNRCFGDSNKITYLGLKNCNFSSIPTSGWGNMFYYGGASGIVMDFSGSIFNESAEKTVVSWFIPSTTNISIIMNGCTSGALELMKSYVNGSRVNTVTIYIDGKKWTKASQSADWVESDV